MKLVDLEAARLARKRRLLAEAQRVVTDIKDARARKAYRDAYDDNLEAEKRLLGIDHILENIGE